VIEDKDGSRVVSCGEDGKVATSSGQGDSQAPDKAQPCLREYVPGEADVEIVRASQGRLRHGVRYA
jgi:hypothetical protein